MAYKATRQFMDRKGKSYKLGDTFEGEQADIEYERKAGNIAEEQEEQQAPPGGRKGGGEPSASSGPA